MARGLAREFPSVQSAYDSIFPDGVDRIYMSGEGLLYGVRAVINTIEAIYPDLPRPTVQQLLNIRDNMEYQQ